MAIFSAISGRYANLDSFCRDTLLIVACYYAYPECNPQTRTQFLLCENICPKIDKVEQRCRSLFDELRHVVPRPFGVSLANFNCSNISTYAIPGIPIDQQCKNFPRLCELPYNNTGTEDVVSWHLQVVFITMHMLLS